MNKEIAKWTVRELRENYPLINFPEYQREPNLWSRVEKQRLIDSIIRHFDIASLYFYRHKDGSIDCVDGRQRIGAIMSFLGESSTDADADFPFKSLNEIYEDDPSSGFRSLEGKNFSEIKELSQSSQNQMARNFVDALLDYPLTVVMLSDSRRSQEFNLQFTRLNLGTIINSGEKLHAMVGDLRNVCFDRLGPHPFLKGTDIPTRRYAREQVAAQILAQVFSLSDTKEYTRIRHFDLQHLFKQNSRLSNARLELIDQVIEILDLLNEPFRKVKALRNRAITVSTVLLAWRIRVETAEKASSLAEFIEEFVCRLNWQVGKGLSIEPEYHYLLDFQRSITQASAEKSSVKARADLLEAELNNWFGTKQLKGDSELIKKCPSREPSKECQYQGFPKDHKDFKSPILAAIKTLGGNASKEEIGIQLIRDFDLPSEKNSYFWNEEEISYKKKMRRRKNLFEDRLSLAIDRLRKDNTLQNKGGKLAFTERDSQG